jgi:hypothetical protein
MYIRGKISPYELIVLKLNRLVAYSELNKKLKNLKFLQVLTKSYSF